MTITLAPINVQTTGVHHVASRCTDLQRARVFFVDRLGFRPRMDAGSGYAAGSGRQSYQLRKLIKHTLIVFLCLQAGALRGLAQTKESQSDPRLPEIHKVIALLDQSTVKRDEALGRTVLHDEFSFVNPFGLVLDKERFVKSILLGNNIYEEHQTEELSVRFFGDVASCRGLLKFRVNVNGQSRDIQARVTIVIVKEKGQWLVFTYHSSTLPPPRPPQQPIQPATPPPAPIRPPSES